MSAMAALILASSRAATSVCTVAQVSCSACIASIKPPIFSPAIAAKASGNRSVAAQISPKAVALGVAFFFVFRGLVMCDSSASLCPLSVGALSGLFFV